MTLSIIDKAFLLPYNSKIDAKLNHLHLSLIKELLSREEADVYADLSPAGTLTIIALC